MQPDLEIRKMLLDIHLAEYEVQATRITYWITLQYATYTIAAVGVGLLVQAASSLQLLTVLIIAILLGQIFALAMLHINQEMFTSVVYIEHRIKRRVSNLIEQECSQEFWEFEPILAKARASQSMAKFEARYVLPSIFGAVIAIGLAVIFWKRHALGAWKDINFFWLFCNACVLPMVIAKLPAVLKLQAAVLGKHDMFSLQDSPSPKEGNEMPTTKPTSS